MMKRSARIDPSLVARLGLGEDLRYDDGGSPAEDRPAHVRAASALRHAGTRLVVVQDDTHVLALHEAGRTLGLLLPASDGVRTFEARRGNKHAKLDLEACVALPDGRLVAFGSGSTHARERLVVLEGEGGVRVVDGSQLYAVLRSELDFAGSELNIEGAVVLDDVLRLFQRGNGAARAGILPVNATCDVSLAAFVRFLDDGGEAPPMRDVVQYDLGFIGDRPYGFTDAAVMPDGRLAFVCAVEASPDSVQDGSVLGCRFGIIAGDDVRTTDVLDERGLPSALKLEGIEPVPGQAGQFYVVADMDDPDSPARLARLTVREGVAS